MQFSVEITDTFSGEANYSWVRRHSFTMPELTHYGYDGSQGYVKANKAFNRQLVRKAKALAGWTGQKCKVERYGETVRIEPVGTCLVAFVDHSQI